MMSPTSTSRPRDGTSLESRLLGRIREEIRLRHQQATQINEENHPHKLRLNSDTCEWELRVDNPGEAPGPPFWDGHRYIDGDEKDE